MEYPTLGSWRMVISAMVGKSFLSLSHSLSLSLSLSHSHSLSLSLSLSLYSVYSLLLFAVDITVYRDGFHGDLNETMFVGDVSDTARKLVQCAYDSMMKGISIGTHTHTHTHEEFVLNKVHVCVCVCVQ